MQSFALPATLLVPQRLAKCHGCYLGPRSACAAVLNVASRLFRDGVYSGQLSSTWSLTRNNMSALRCIISLCVKFKGLVLVVFWAFELQPSGSPFCYGITQQSNIFWPAAWHRLKKVCEGTYHRIFHHGRKGLPPLLSYRCSFNVTVHLGASEMLWEIRCREFVIWYIVGHGHIPQREFLSP